MPINLAITVLTSPRPKATLQTAVASLAQAGYDGPEVWIHEDSPPSGHYTAYLSALAATLDARPKAEAIFLLEDDVILCRGLADYLDRELWPAEPDTIGLVSPYCPAAYAPRRRGLGRQWRTQNRGWALAGSQAWIFPRLSAERIVETLGPRQSNYNADAEIGKFLQTAGLACWYHSPSLVEHIGIGNSALGDDLAGPLRQSADFIGTLANPNDLFK